MKNTLAFITLILLLLIKQDVFGQQAEWVAKTVTTGNNYTRALTIEGDYVYSGGRHRSPSYYVSGNDSIFIPQWYGSRDIYFAKYNKSTGKQIFVKHYGTSKSEQVWNITSDGQGGIYVQGEYFDSLNIDNKIIYGLGKHDSFLAKFDTSGNCQWLKGFSSPNGAYINDIRIEAKKVYVAGGYTDKMLVFNNSDTVNGGGGFIHRYDLMGNFEWGITDTSKSAKGSISFQGICVQDSTIFFTGGVNYLTKLGNYSIQATNNQWGDFVLGCIENDTVKWVKNSGTSYSENAIRIEKVKNSLYIAGTFTGKSEFLGENINAGDTLGSAAQLYNKQNIFVLKTDLEGNLVFLESIKSSISRFGGLKVDYNEVPWISGMFQDTVSIKDSTFYAKGGSDIFITKINSNGISPQIRHFGGDSLNVVEAGLGDRAHDLDIDESSNAIYVTGAFSGDYNFSGLSGKGHFNNNHYGVLVKFRQEVDLKNFSYDKEICVDSSYSIRSPYYSELDTVSWKVISPSGIQNYSGTVLNFAPVDSGEYKVSLSVMNKNSNDTIQLELKAFICKNDSGANDTTHVENLFKKKESFYLFPNPTSDLLNMVFFNSEVPFEISVTSILGNVLYQGVYANNQSINISNLPEGLYFLRAHYENGEIKAKQFIKH